MLRLSSKGQLVIPRSIRESLHLKNGDQFQAQVVDGKIILEPVVKDIIQRLHGKFAGENMLNDLEEEHKREVDDE